MQGLLVCSECGFSFYKTSTSTTKRKICYYRCFGSDNYRFEKGRKCSNRPIRQDILDEFVWEHIIRLLENPMLVADEIERRYQEALTGSATHLRRDTLSKEATHTKNAMNKLLDAFQEGLIEIDELRKRMTELRKREMSVNSQLLSLEAKPIEQSQLLEYSLRIEKILKSLRDSAKNLSVLERQKVLRLIVKEVLVNVDKITIKHSIPITNAGTASSKEKKSYQQCLWRINPSLRRS